jgi:hypothetical protein
MGCEGARQRSRTARLALAAAVLALPLVPVGLGAGPAAPSPAEKPGGSGAKKSGAKKDAKNKKTESPEKPGRVKPPQRVGLPAAGVYLAPKLLRLAGKLHGLPVRVAHKRLNRVRVTVTPELARRRVTIRELKLVLLAHSIYLHLWEHSRRGTILVAAREPEWTPPIPRYTRVFQVREGDFKQVARVVREAVAGRNRRLPRGLRPVAVAVSERNGKIVVRAPSRKLVDEIGDLIDRFDHQDPKRPRLYTHTLPTLRGEVARGELLERLSEGERRRARVTVGPSGTRLLYRADPELAEKIRRLLQEIDG